MRLVSKINHEKFVKGVRKGLLDMGATKAAEDYLPNLETYNLDTIAGKLEIHLWTERSGLHNVTAEFLDTDAAKVKIWGCKLNPKYNIHILNIPKDVKANISEALTHFQRVLPK